MTVPFVSGLCPNDTYHIWKRGNSVRMDTSLGKKKGWTPVLSANLCMMVRFVLTDSSSVPEPPIAFLVGFENMKWLRGHISIIFRVHPETGTHTRMEQHCTATRS